MYYSFLLKKLIDCVIRKDFPEGFEDKAHVTCESFDCFQVHSSTRFSVNVHQF